MSPMYCHRSKIENMQNRRNAHSEPRLHHFKSNICGEQKPPNNQTGDSSPSLYLLLPPPPTPLKENWSILSRGRVPLETSLSNSTERDHDQLLNWVCNGSATPGLPNITDHAAIPIFLRDDHQGWHHDYHGQHDHHRKNISRQCICIPLIFTVFESSPHLVIALAVTFNESFNE